MSTQIMYPGDGRPYDPSRDVAYCLPGVIQEMRQRVLGPSPPWQSYRDLAVALKVTEEELASGVDRLVQFAVKAVDKPKQSMASLLVECGWFELRSETQILVAAALGQACMSMFFTGARMATIGGRGPCDALVELRQSPNELWDALHCPWWAKPIRGVRRFLGTMATAWRGGRS